jgi:molybdopterin molybdotransferase
MRSATDVLAEELALARPLPAADLSLADASGLVLAEDVVSPTTLPRFDNAAMDGFAVRASDLAGASRDAPVRLRIVGTSVAGEPCRITLAEGSALRIATGAPTPAGGDAVVRVEDADVAEADAALFGAVVAPGANVRRAGEDVRAGNTLLVAGVSIGPGQVAAAAAAGIDRVPVHRRPLVTVIVTGDEVVPAGSAVGEAHVLDAIGPPVCALLENAGCVPSLLGPIPDDAGDAAHALIDAARAADVVITAGGISIGPRDHVRTALSSAGASVVPVAIRPGKPFAFGRQGSSLLFGLPGNPVSALVAFEVFVRPAIAVLMGRAPGDRPRVAARLEEPFEQRPGRLHLVRAHLDRTPAGPRVRPLGPHAAGSLGSLARANAWMVVPADVGRLETGAEVETWPMLPC